MHKKVPEQFVQYQCFPHLDRTIITVFPFSLYLFSLAFCYLFFLNVAISKLHIYIKFPAGSEVKASACNAGDLGSIPGLGRSPGEGNSNLLHYSVLENPMRRGA